MLKSNFPFAITTKKILWLLGIYFLLRLIFIFFNFDLFSDLSFQNIVFYLFLGFRFDLMTLFILNSIWILLINFPAKFIQNKTISFFLISYFVIINFLGIIVNLIDVVFFRFNMKRISTDILSLLDVVPTLIGSFVVDFWYMFVFAILLLVFIYKIARYELTPLNKKQSFLSFFIVLIVFAIGFRGGIQRKPLRPLSAAEFVNINHTPIVLNSAFTFIKSLTKRELDLKKYFSDDEAKSIYNPVFPPYALSKNKKNIIIIILESISQEFIQTYNKEHNATPFLDELILKSTSFKNAFANGRRSSEALVSILSGIPNLMDDPYLHSNYADTSFTGLANNLKKMGYSSYFFNGSNKSTLGWSDFIMASGFNQHISRETYNNENHFDGHWGIYDDYMMNFFSQFGFQEPFLGVLFTLSSHHPYHVRSELPFTKFKNEFINSISYTDYSLKLFFESVKNAPWYKNTIFIITADHSPGAHSIKPEKMISNPFKNKVGMYKVPLIIFNPHEQKPKVFDHAVQHVDLMPTILQIAGFNYSFYSFGKDIFDVKKSEAYQYANGIYQIMDETYVLFFNGDKSVALYNYQSDPYLNFNILNESEIQPHLKKLENKIKAIIQRFNHDLVKNNLSINHLNN
jgi:phosphoglycerol transferase MdoB-like AlkP superfamily enzyme